MLFNAGVEISADDSKIREDMKILPTVGH